MPLFFVCTFIVGCDSHRNKSINKPIDSVADSVKDITPKAARTAKTERVLQEELDDVQLQKIEVSKGTGSMWLIANIRMDWRIFGYEKPDTASKKMILFSVFTYDVEGNPFKCPYGSYYESSGMNDDGIELRYVGEDGVFIKSEILKSDTPKATVYIEKKWVEFD
jgi:hypothetical protein